VIWLNDFRGPRFTSEGPCNEEDLLRLATAVMKRRIGTDPTFWSFSALR